MNLGIVTIAFNDYGRFLPIWCQSIASLTRLPSQVTVALGKDHGLSTTDRKKSFDIIPGLQIVEHTELATMGALRNAAVRATPTEWIQYLSIDDQIYPWAVDEYEHLAVDADFISIAWDSIATWQLGAPTLHHKARIPEVMAREQGGKGFVSNQSPYRRHFWERSPYLEHDYPNAPFIAGMVEAGARFVGTEQPCTLYLRRLDSHCGKNLGRRGNSIKRKVVRKEKQQAKYWKRNAELRIKNYYER